MRITKYRVILDCPHISDRKWWLLGGQNDKVTVFLHGCYGCAAIAEQAGIEIDETEDPR